MRHTYTLKDVDTDEATDGQIQIWMRMSHLGNNVITEVDMPSREDCDYFYAQEQSNREEGYELKELGCRDPPSSKVPLYSRVMDCAELKCTCTSEQRLRLLMDACRSIGVSTVASLVTCSSSEGGSRDSKGSKGSKGKDKGVGTGDGKKDSGTGTGKEKGRFYEPLRFLVSKVTFVSSQKEEAATDTARTTRTTRTTGCRRNDAAPAALPVGSTSACPASPAIHAVCPAFPAACPAVIHVRPARPTSPPTSRRRPSVSLVSSKFQDKTLPYRMTNHSFNKEAATFFLFLNLFIDF